uniref:Uncharacterized protein n=1 Tax=Eutreptiella gymnastica TaxID=73025 RepID=A0A7S4LNS6_9EUGL
MEWGWGATHPSTHSPTYTGTSRHTQQRMEWERFPQLQQYIDDTKQHLPTTTTLQAHTHQMHNMTALQQSTLRYWHSMTQKCNKIKGSKHRTILVLTSTAATHQPTHSQFPKGEAGGSFLKDTPTHSVPLPCPPRLSTALRKACPYKEVRAIAKSHSL